MVRERVRLVSLSKRAETALMALVNWLFWRIEQKVGDVGQALLVFQCGVLTVEGEVPRAETAAEGVAARWIDGFLD